MKLPTSIVIMCLIFIPFICHAATPGIDLDDYGAATWSFDASAPQTGLDFYVKIIDYDGIAADGSSHTVTVTYPDGTTQRSLGYSRTIDANTAIYQSWDFVAQPIDDVVYSGTYTFRVADSDSNWSEVEDELAIAPINPPDETTFTPNFSVAQSVAAYFDNAYTDGVFFDDFDTGIDGAKWNWDSNWTTSDSNAVRFDQAWQPGCGQGWMTLTDPNVNSLKATTWISAISGNHPRSQVGGVFCQADGDDVFAAAGITDSEAFFTVYKVRQEGSHTVLDFLVPFTSLGSVVQGNRYDITVDWNETLARIDVAVTGLDDTVAYSDDHTLSGSIDASANSWKGLGVECQLMLDTTTPTFSWAPISGVNHYRVRVYSAFNQSLYNGYTTQPSLLLPPGVLRPYGFYKLRVYARGDHQWFEVDNQGGSDRNQYCFVAGPLEAQDPFGEVRSVGTRTWMEMPPFGANLYFDLYVHDAQGVPDNIDTVTAQLPGGGPTVELFWVYNESTNWALYRGCYLASVPGGTYTYTIVDKDTNAFILEDELNSAPIAYMDESSLVPINQAVLDDTGSLFTWDPVLEGGLPAAAYYELRFFDKATNLLFRRRTTDTQYLLPPGLLAENDLYKYRVYPRREFFENDLDNSADSPPGSHSVFHTTSTIGSSTPIIDPNSNGVFVSQAVNLGTGLPTVWLEFRLAVTDADGVPANIASVAVTYPDGITTRMLSYIDNPLGNSNYEAFEYYATSSLIQDATNTSGIYTFTVTDFEGHVVSFADRLPSVSAGLLDCPEDLNPTNSTRLANTTPRFSWDAVDEAACYQVRVYGSWDNTEIYRSDKISSTHHTIPHGTLAPHATYSYRVYAFRESAGSEVDFLSHNLTFHPVDLRFVTGEETDDPIISDIAYDRCISERCTSAISVSATDPSGGNLSYDWEAQDGGTIIGSGNAVSFDPPGPSMRPDCDPFRIKVTATSDDSGLNTEETIDIHVKYAGDVDGNGVVNILDKVAVRNAFGSSGSPGWIDADVDCNGVVNILDKVIIRNQFGQTGCECD